MEIAARFSTHLTSLMQYMQNYIKSNQTISLLLATLVCIVAGL